MRDRRARRKAPVAALLLPAAALLPLAGGCGARLSRENARLRERVMDLTGDVERLSDRVAELEAELAGAARVPESLPPEVRANIPHVASIAVGRLSHARDTDGDGREDVLILYVVPRDGLGRFVQMVGTLSAHAAVLPPDGEAITVGRVRLDPGALRAAYRSSVMGTHYTVRVPIEPPAEAGSAGPIVVVVEYVDGRDGRRLDARRDVPVGSGEAGGGPS